MVTTKWEPGQLSGGYDPNESEVPWEPARVYIVVGLLKASGDPMVLGVYPDPTRAEAGAWRALNSEEDVCKIEIQERVLNE